MRKITILVILLTLSAFSAHSKVWMLADSNLEINFDDQTSLIKILDKRCNKVWEQTALSNNFKVEKTVQNGNSLKLIFSGNFNFEAELTLRENASFEIVIEADENLTVDNFEFPSAFKTPDKNHFILMTDGEGLLLQADDKEYPMSNGVTYYTGGGLAMAWMGVVDPKFETGYMAILETPFDAGLRTHRENGLVT